MISPSLPSCLRFFCLVWIAIPLYWLTARTRLPFTSCLDDAATGHKSPGLVRFESTATNNYSIGLPTAVFPRRSTPLHSPVPGTASSSASTLPARLPAPSHHHHQATTAITNHHHLGRHPLTRFNHSYRSFWPSSNPCQFNNTVHCRA